MCEKTKAYALFADEFIKLLQMLENSCVVHGLTTGQPDSFNMLVPFPVYSALSVAIRSWKGVSSDDHQKREEKIRLVGREAVEKEEALLPLYLTICTEHTPGGIKIRPLGWEKETESEPGTIQKVD